MTQLNHSLPPPISIGGGRGLPLAGLSADDPRATRGRARTPEDTFRAYQHLIKVAGITRIADITGLDTIGIPVSLCIRPLARSLVVSVGKGLDSTSARAAALMESLESWYAENITLPSHDGSFEYLTGDLGFTAVNLESLPRALDCYSDEPSTCEWLRGTDLGTGRDAWVPLEAVSLDFRLDHLGVPWLARNSNGLASGNNRAEAILHGLCEVVERDAEWRWRHSGDSRRLDLDTITDPPCRWLMGRIRSAGVFIAVWDITNESGLPCFGCVLLSDPAEGGWSHVGAHDGFCCHPAPGRALCGALLEAVQKRLTYISGSRDDVTRHEMERVNSMELARKVWAELHAESADRDYSHTVPVDRGETGEDVLVVLERLLSTDVSQIVVVDLSENEDEPAVVKVVIPGFHGPYGACLPPMRGE